MQVRLLGPVAAMDRSGREVAVGGPKERRVLAALAVDAGDVVSEDRLVDVLWGEDPPRTATKTLRTYISRLRRALAPDGRIDTVPSGYRLHLDEGVDADVVAELLGRSREATSAGDHEEAARLLHQAEGRWHGTALGDLADEPWAVAEAARLEELRMVVLEERVAAQLAVGAHADLTGELESLTARHPLRERLWGQRMLALYRSGRQGEALRAYQEVRGHLAEELGLDPGPLLRSVEQAILEQSPDLDWRPPTPAAAPRPPVTPLPTGVVTFVLTDIEGSTELWDRDPDAMADALARHDELVASVVEEGGGTVIKSKGEGDATLSVFQLPSDAAAAALGIQEAIEGEAWPGGLAVRVRIGAHTGEAYERGGDYFGPTVNRAARLRALAEGGEVLLSGATAELVRDHLRGRAVLVDRGRHQLRGLSRDEQVFLLSRPRQPRRSRPPLALPRPLPLTVAGDLDFFVGRDAALDRLTTGWAQALAGERRLVLVSGEPGAGKTRLVTELAERIDGGGPRPAILYGHCDEHVAPPYQALAEALTGYFASCPDDRLPPAATAGALVRLVPRLAERISGTVAPPAGHGEAERRALFEAVAAVLDDLAASNPVLLVVDDLQWAAVPTLSLLRHVLTAAEPGRLLVVGAYRDNEIERSKLAELGPAADDIRLAGLDQAEAAAFVAAAAGHELDPPSRRLARDLQRHTGGNPFFMGQILRHFAEQGTVYQRDGRWTTDPSSARLVLPDGVTEVVAQRLARLSDAVRSVLTVAAVVGDEFDLDVVRAAADPDADVDGAVAHAVVARLVDAGERAATFRFAHGLVRHVLLDQVPASSRRRLHHRVATVLEDEPRGAPAERLAHHLEQAGGAAERTRAAEYHLAAGRAAVDRLAFDEAVRRFGQGLHLIDELVSGDIAVELLLGLADAHRRLGQWDEARDAGHRAAHLARQRGRGVELARAALAYFTWGGVGLPDPVVAELSEEALAALGPDDLALRAKVLAQLARYRAVAAGQGWAAEALAVEAVALARAAGDDEALTAALAAHHVCLFGSPRLAERAMLAEEALDAARRLGDVEAVAFATALRGSARFEQGDLTGFDADAADLVRQADQSGSFAAAYFAGAWQVTRASLEGRFDDADVANADLLAGAGDDPNAHTLFGANLALLLHERGRDADLTPLIEVAALDRPDLAAFRALLARTAAELGDVEAARDHLDGLAADDFAALPRDPMWPAALSLLAEAAARIGDRDHAATLYALLSPYRGSLLSCAGASACTGTADRHLGMLAMALGRLDEAEELLRAAVDLEERLGAIPYLARTRTWLARLLLDRGRRSDRPEAAELLAAAARDAASLGMAGVAEEIRRLKRPPLPPSIRATATFVGRREELARLERRWQEAGAGATSVVLVAGEPGIGKSTLAAELARTVAAAGATVLHGRSDEGLDPAYRPFADALRDAVTRRAAADLVGLGPALSHLVRLLPELAPLAGDAQPRDGVDADADRHALFDAVVQALRLVAEDGPVLLVLDDIHWAARSSLLLLRHVARTPDLPLLVVATHRTDEVDSRHPAADILADLPREPAVARLDLRGLEPAEVADLVALGGRGGTGTGDDVAGHLHAETRGNPFLVGELLRHLEEGGDRGRLPEGARTVLGRRLDRLERPVEKVLATAAVIGPSFTRLELAAVVGDAVMTGDAVDAGIAADLLEESDGRLRFPHALVREAVLDRVGPARRARLHRQVGAALAALPDAGDRVEELAHHFAEAASDGEGARAADYGLRAAKLALERSSYEEASARVVRALAAVDEAGLDDPRRRADLLLALGDARERRNDIAGMREAALAAAAAARRAGSADQLAQAALLLTTQGNVTIGASDPLIAEVCREALDALGPRRPALRARVLAGLSRYLVSGAGRPGEAVAAAEEAVVLARALGASDTLVDALAALAAALEDLPGIDRRRAVFDELTERVGLTTDARTAVSTHLMRARFLLETGDLDGVRDAVAALEAIGHQRRSWAALAAAAGYRAGLDLLAGRWADAEAHAAEVLEHGGHDPDLVNVWAALVAVLHRELGRLQELGDQLAAMAADPQSPVVYRAGLALLHAEAGRRDDVHALLVGLAGPDGGFADLPADGTLTALLAIAAEAAAVAADTTMAAPLYERLLPYREQLIDMAGSGACFGPVEQYLGALASLLGRHDVAEQHLRSAVERAAALPSEPLIARTRYWLAWALIARNGPGDRRHAGELLASVIAGAEAAGLPRLEAEARALAPAASAVVAPPFVGRDQELDELVSSWRAAVAGAGSTVLVAGEPGIGKTRLVEELARLAAAQGGTVLRGGCTAEGGVPYEPFAHALGSHLGPRTAGELAVLPPRPLAELSRLLPWIGDRMPLPAPLRGEPEAERHALFDAMATVLVALGERTPVLLLVEDLQWAGTPSLLALRHVIRAVGGGRVLVVGTYRDTDLDRNHPLRAALAELRREPRVTRLVLGGIPPEAAEQLVSGPPTEERIRMARRAHAEAAGNPFFLTQLLRAADEGGVLGADVADLVADRLDRLGGAAGRVLAAAAVVGPTFSVGILEQMPTAGTADEVLDVVDDAVAARLLEERTDGTLGFTHDIVRQVLLDDLDPLRRAVLHREAGEALERRPDRGAVLETLAHHFAAAGDAKALAYGLAAGRQAMTRLAFEAAEAILERAVVVAGAVQRGDAGAGGPDEGDPGDDMDGTIAAELLLALAEARMVAGRTQAGKEAARLAAEAARTAGAPRLLAQAVVRYQGWGGVGEVDPLVPALCREALEGLSEDDLGLRARVQASLADYLASNEADIDSAQPVAEQAVADARRSADPEILLEALAARTVALFGSERVKDRLALTEERLLLAEEVDSAQHRASALAHRAACRLEQGDLGGFDDDLAALDELARGLGAWYPHYFARSFHAMRAILTGDHDRADRSLAALGELTGDHPNAASVWAANSLLLARDRGRLHEVLDLLRAAVTEQPIVAFRAALAVVLAELDQEEEARSILAEMVGDDVAGVPRDRAYPVALTLLAEVAARLDDRAAAARLLPRLAPYGGLLVASAGATFCLGSADRHLGMLHAVLGDRAGCDTAFERALALEDGIGAAPSACRTRVWWARTLLARGDGDRARARSLLETALAQASSLGMEALAGEAARLLLPPVPLPLRHESPAFVGRDDELHVLTQAWKDARAGRPRAVLVAGEPGVGKTRLAGELARRAHDEGALVLHGRCDDGLGAPYQPFAEAIAAYSSTVGGHVLADVGEAALRALARVVPSLGDRVPAATRAQPDPDRLQLFDAVAALLTGASTRSPVVLVIDDLHWASLPTLRLLCHLIRPDHGGRLLVIGTYRDTELDRLHPLPGILADLRRRPDVARVRLRGLDVASLAALVEAETGRPLDDRAAELADALHAQTDGNPFFATEVLRHLAASGDLDGPVGRAALALPEGVREVIGRRLSRLSTAAEGVLAAAAVVGPSFSTRVLEAVVGGDGEAVVDALDEATAAGLVVEQPDGAMSFTHALIRQALVGELTAARRTRLHRSIVEALQRVAPEDVEALAHHAVQAAAVGEGAAMAAHVRRAAARAVERLAFEEAATHLERGLAALDLDPGGDPATRAELLLDLADARLLAGEMPRVHEAVVAAAEAARAAGSATLLARAAASNRGTTGLLVTDPTVPALCREALAALPPEEHGLRARVLSRLADYIGIAEVDRAAAEPLAAESVAEARRSGDPEAVVEALSGLSMMLWGTPRIADRLDVAEERLAAAAVTGRVIDRAEALFYRAGALFEGGDLTAFDRDLDEIEDLGRRSRAWRIGFMVTSLRTMRALLDGRLDDAVEALARQSAHAGEDANARNVAAGSAFLLARERGELADWVPLLEVAAAENPVVSFRGALAVAYLEVDRPADAAAVVDGLAPGDFAAVPRDPVFPVTLVQLAEVAAGTGAREHAGVLLRLLEPWRGLMAASAAATFCLGAVDRYLAMLHAALGRAGEAAELYRAALALEESMGAVLHAARTRQWQARLQG